MASAEEMERMMQTLKEDKASRDCCSGSSCKPKKAKKEEREVPKDNKQLFSIILFILMFGGAAISLIISVADFVWHPVSHLDVRNSETAKKVIFDGNANLFFCAPSGQKFDDKFLKETATLIKKDKIGTYTLNCQEKLTSGKTILERLGLPSSTFYFTCANHDQVRAIAPSEFPSPESFANHVRETTRPREFAIESANDFNKKCMKKEKCLVIANRGNIDAKEFKNYFFDVISEVRTLRVVKLNSIKFIFKIHQNLIQNTPLKVFDASLPWHRSANLVCLVNKKKETGEIETFATVYQKEIDDLESLHQFFQTCDQSRMPHPLFTLLPEQPSLQIRTAVKKTPPPPPSPTPSSPSPSASSPKQTEWDDLINDIREEL